MNKDLYHCLPALVVSILSTEAEEPCSEFFISGAEKLGLEHLFFPI